MEGWIAQELVKAIRDRNEIEKQKLTFDKEMFEFNKQLNIDATKANTDMATILASYSDMVRKMNENIEKLFQNDMYFKQEIEKLREQKGIPGE